MPYLCCYRALSFAGATDSLTSWFLHNLEDMLFDVLLIKIENMLIFQVKFSPFVENRIAVSTSENFGIVGTGRQYILDVSVTYDEFLGQFPMLTATPS